VAGYIAGWQPSSASPEAVAFARTVVQAAGPPGRQRAKNLLRAAAKLADYAISLGLDTVPEVLLHPSVIEGFTAHAPGLSGPARRTLRTNLRFAAGKVVPQLHPADAPLPRERAKCPAAPWRPAATGTARPSAMPAQRRGPGLVTGSRPAPRHQADPGRA